ncbi:MAG: glycogen debranching enzyme N-terminal domain-containing protein, partial [Chthonomonadaceae bacterium]|nr:glycogen debranching enzyme N-terminal domain-containing protein [Chthonomonadaceae bacterium]
MPDDAHISFGPDVLRDTTVVFQREWLVTNGLGGYASATLGTASTRRYHGLLVAALRPPLGRAVLLSRLEAVLEVNSAPGLRAYPLAANFYPDTIHPQGYRWLESWQAYPAPTWVWAPEPGIRLEKRIWMPRGRNSVCIAYRLNALPAGHTALLRLTPLLAWKDYHSEMRCADPPRTTRTPEGIQLELPPIWQVTSRPTTLRIALLREDGSSYPGTAFQETGWWYYRFQHPREWERGMEGEEDLYTPGDFVAPLHAGETLVAVASVEPDPDPPARDTWEALVSRQQSLVQVSGARDHFTRQLVLAADAFVVQ